jgi:arylformamidase
MMLPGRFVDLSHKMVPGREEYGLELETHETAELYPQYEVSDGVWYILQSVHMGSHCGTHIEFPYHHNRQGLDAGGFPLERLIGECVLLDFRSKEPNEAVTLEELRAREDEIRQGDMVMFNFGCAKHYGTELGHTRPYIAHEAIRWLVDDRRINLIGSDASGIEIKGVADQPNHQYLMDHQVPIIEFAANLDSLTATRFDLLVLALPIVGLDSCPVRLLAIEPETPEK